MPACQLGIAEITAAVATAKQADLQYIVSGSRQRPRLQQPCAQFCSFLRQKGDVAPPPGPALPPGEIGRSAACVVQAEKGCTVLNQPASLPSTNSTSEPSVAKVLPSISFAVPDSKAEALFQAANQGHHRHRVEFRNSPEGVACWQ